MDLIELRMRTIPEEWLSGDALADLLRQWILRTPLGDALVDVSLRPRGDEALARLQADRRTVEVLLHHEGGPASNRLLIEAWTWVTPQPAATFAPLAIGVAVSLLGLLVTAVWFSDGLAPVIVGVFLALALGALIASALRQRSIHRRTVRATEQAGGQTPARELLEQLDEVVRSDPRVVDVMER